MEANELDFVIWLLWTRCLNKYYCILKGVSSVNNEKLSLDGSIILWKFVCTAKEAYLPFVLGIN